MFDFRKYEYNLAEQSSLDFIDLFICYLMVSMSSLRVGFEYFFIKKKVLCPSGIEDNNKELFSWHRGKK